MDVNLIGRELVAAICPAPAVVRAKSMSKRAAVVLMGLQLAYGVFGALYATRRA